MRNVGERPPETTDIDLLYAVNGNPVVYLRTFLEMRRSKEWRWIAFDHAALDWITAVWNEAAAACVGDSRLRDACIHERDRYAHLSNGLKAKIHEFQEPGAVYLNEPSDWPPRDVIRGAIKALEHAQVRRVQ